MKCECGRRDEGPMRTSVILSVRGVHAVWAGQAADQMPEVRQVTTRGAGGVKSTDWRSSTNPSAELRPHHCASSHCTASDWFTELTGKEGRVTLTCHADDMPDKEANQSGGAE